MPGKARVRGKGDGSYSLKKTPMPKPTAAKGNPTQVTSRLAASGGKKSKMRKGY